MEDKGFQEPPGGWESPEACPLNSVVCGLSVQSLLSKMTNQKLDLRISESYHGKDCKKKTAKNTKPKQNVVFFDTQDIVIR